MRYGTSGFRDHHTKIESIAEKIGIAVAQLAFHRNSSFGIMITASHNHHDDNGVKIMDDRGDMVTSDIEQILEDVINSGDIASDKNISEVKRTAFFGANSVGDSRSIPIHIRIGYDSRLSSPTICRKIVQGILLVHPEFPFTVYEYVTTPQLHYAVWNEHNCCESSHTFSQNLTYLEYAQRASNLVNTQCVLDCANGIGAKVMRYIANPNITLVNSEWTQSTLLNASCSSDFVCTNKKIPVLGGINSPLVQDQLCASFDGDADRIVFYSCGSDGCLNIFNGDYIAALVLTYLSKYLANTRRDQDITIGFVYTGYTNKACLDYVKSLTFPENIHVSYVCTATGVKHLHHEAMKYDVGVYFEQNGHGNVIFGRPIAELTILSQLFHPVIGDGVMDLFATLYILQEMEWSVQDWAKTYVEYPSKLGKCAVLDKTHFRTCGDESELIEPTFLQEYINKLCSSQTLTCRAFVRASGTENVVRLYVESIDDYIVGEVYSKIEAFINIRLNTAQYKIKDATFIVRALTCEDVGRPYYELLGQLTKIDPERMDSIRTRTFIEGLGPNHQIFVVEHCESGRVVGSGTLLVEEKLIRNYGKVGHIEDIVVHADYRGYGLGKILIDYLTSMGKNQACYKCILDCDEKNVGFYEKCEYVRKGIEMARYM
jgi:phosphoacetylglucosamine mutase